MKAFQSLAEWLIHPLVCLGYILVAITVLTFVAFTTFPPITDAYAQVGGATIDGKRC